MPTWAIGLVLLSCAGLGLSLIFRRTRQRRRERLELRLLAGRSQLLEGEIANQLQNLTDFDEERLNALRLEADNALNLLQVTLIERQAHLLNCEDLTYLQKYKVNILNNHVETQNAAPPPPDNPPAAAPMAATSMPPPSQDHPKDRSSIENELLNKINQLNQADKQGRKPPKK